VLPELFVEARVSAIAGNVRMKSSSLLTFVGAVTVSTSALGQAPCPSCSPCSTSPIVETGIAGPQAPSGNGTFPLLRVRTFDTSLGTLTGVQVTVTAYAVDRSFRVENTNPSCTCPGGDPTHPATLDIQASVMDPSNIRTILEVNPMIDPSWHLQDVFPPLGEFDCCLDYGICDNDPGPGVDFQCCPSCPIPMGAGPIIPSRCPTTAPPPCTTPGPQASGYHRSWANTSYSVTTMCITSNLDAYLSSSGPLVTFPVTAIAPEDTGSSLCAGSIDKHWNSKLRLTMRVAYTYCPNGAPTFCPMCFGDNATTPCPCSNTGLPAHGCNNSSATGGAILTASGTTNPDTVMLTSNGELASVLSIVLQGDTLLPQPVAFGDGLRCIGGTLLRLYTTHAVNGSVSAPGAGDPSITTRSATLGDPIARGSTRSYQTYYRDPDLAGCTPPNTWNVSSGITVAW
jgi:hypothetical protein